MDLVVSGTDDSLVEQLSFKLPSTASYANERRLVSAFPSGASQFSPDGVRVARFVITGENWLDPSTLRLAFKLKKLIGNSDAAAGEWPVVPLRPGAPARRWSRSRANRRPVLWATARAF